MARFDFQSPGAAFTEQIAQSLAQRKAEERQMLLDSLTVNAESRAQEEAARQAQSHQLAVEAAGRRKTADEQALEIERLGVLEAPLDIGADPAERGYSPEDLDLFKKWGRLNKLPTPSVSTDTQFTAPEGATMEPGQAPAGSTTAPTPQPTKYGYVGSAQDRERQRLQQQSAQMLATLGQDPEMVEAVKFLTALAQANDGIVPMEAAAKLTQPAGRGIVFNEPSGTFTMGGKPFDASKLRPTDKIFERGYGPSSMYSDPRDRYMQNYGPEGGYVKITPNGPELVTHDINGRPLVTARPPSSGAGGNRNLASLGLDASYLDDIRVAGELVGNDPRAVDLEALAGYRNAMGIAFAQAKIDASPLVRQLAKEYLSDPNATAVKVDNIQLSEKDMNALTTMIGAIPDHVDGILRQNPYNPNPPKSGGFWGFFGK